MYAYAHTSSGATRLFDLQERAASSDTTGMCQLVNRIQHKRFGPCTSKVRNSVQQRQVCATDGSVADVRKERPLKSVQTQYENINRQIDR